MQRAKVSIIVPVYNVGDYLQRCLVSIVEQTYDKLEVIVIDDGSTDHSREVCESFAKSDSRMKFVSRENQGVAATREEGVRRATCDYIMFVDPDDSLPTDAVEILMEGMTPEIDIVVGASNRIEISGEECYEEVNKAGVISREEYIWRLLAMEIRVTPWGKLYRKSLFGSDSFPRRKRGEDYLMNIAISPKVRAVNLINRSIYNYYKRLGCLTARVYLPTQGVQGFVPQMQQVMREHSIFEEFKRGYVTFAIREIGITNARGNQRSKEDREWIDEALRFAEEFSDLSPEEQAITHNERKRRKWERYPHLKIFSLAWRYTIKEPIKQIKKIFKL